MIRSNFNSATLGSVTPRNIKPEIALQNRKKEPSAAALFDCDALGQIARLIDVGAPLHRDMVGQKLQRHG